LERQETSVGYYFMYRLLAAQDRLDVWLHRPIGEGEPYLEPFVGGQRPPPGFNSWRLRVVGVENDDEWIFPAGSALQRLLREAYPAYPKAALKIWDRGPNFLILHVTAGVLEPHGMGRLLESIKKHKSFHPYEGHWRRR
jgi:hypothetical protein